MLHGPAERQATGAARAPTCVQRLPLTTREAPVRRMSHLLRWPRLPAERIAASAPTSATLGLCRAHLHDRHMRRAGNFAGVPHDLQFHRCLDGTAAAQNLWHVGVSHRIIQFG